MRLVWYQRPDGLWNAACACNAAVCGVDFARRAQAEEWHFDLTRMERDHRSKHAPDTQIPACGPKLPEVNPNEPGPAVFP